MIFENQNYVPLGRLSSRLDLPKKYLKELASKKIIPSLIVNSRMRFNPESVKAVLDRIASRQRQADRHSTVLGGSQ